jgi:hypothetical protein
MAEITSFPIVLDSEDDGKYHIKNSLGEVERKHLIDRGSSIVVQAESIWQPRQNKAETDFVSSSLVEVDHGKTSPNYW